MKTDGEGLRERVQELEVANQTLWEREQTLSAALDDLYRVTTGLLAAGSLEELYDEIVVAAVGILHADFATVQSLWPDRGSGGELRLCGHRGLDPVAASRWEWIGLANRTSCAEALRTRHRVAAPDIRKSEILTGDDLEAHLAVGIVGAQSTPLLSRTGALVGMVSTYWKQPHVLSAVETHGLDLLARLAADLIERTRAEENLREQEERLRFAQQSGGIGTFDRDVETGKTTWSPEMEAINGFPPGSFPGTEAAWQALLHPDDREEVLQLVARSLETGNPTEGDWRIVRPDGAVSWIYSRWRVLKDERAKPVRVMGVNIDVTDRRQMEEALRRGEERLRLAVKASNDAIWDIDLKADTVTWNDTYAAVYGRNKTEKSWQWWIDRIHPEDRERIEGDFRAAIDGRESGWSGEYRFLRADGTYADVFDRAYIARDTAGEAWRVIGSMQDLTERKRAERAIRESEARFRKMADASPVMIWVAGLDKLCTFFNRTWLTFRGRSMEEELGNGWVDGVHPDDVQKCFQTYSAAFDARQKFLLEYRLQRVDGEYRYVVDSGVPMFTSEGVLEGYIGSCLDVTELKRLEEENLHRQKLESVGVMAAGIAHDFNNLLGGIIAQLQLVEEEALAHAPIMEDLRKIKSLALRGSEIVRELMVYAGRETTNVELLDLSALVGEMLELLKLSISKRATLRTVLTKDLPAIKAQPSQVRQLVMNLITNASEAIGDAEGVITVTTSIDPADRNSVRLQVSDTGCGMTEEQRTHIFDPFFTTKVTGRGLGLAVVQGVVRSHQGQLKVFTAPSQGSTFQILFPSTDEVSENSRPSPPPVAVDKLGISGLTVLVIEDDEMLRQAVAKMLRRRNFTVLEAGDGSVAIDLLRETTRSIQVILLDLTIPGVDSAEVLEEARRVRPGTKVVMTSAYSRAAGARFADVPEIAGYIRKPFLADELTEILTQAAGFAMPSSRG